MRSQQKISKSIFKREAIWIAIILGVPLGVGLFFAFVMPALVKLLR